MNILIKLMSIVSLVIAPHISLNSEHTSSASQQINYDTTIEEAGHPPAIIMTKSELGDLDLMVNLVKVKNSENGDIEKISITYSTEHHVEVYSNLVANPVFNSDIVFKDNQHEGYFISKGKIEFMKGDIRDAKVRFYFDGSVLHDQFIELAGN